MFATKVHTSRHTFNMNVFLKEIFKNTVSSQIAKIYTYVVDCLSVIIILPRSEVNTANIALN